MAVGRERRTLAVLFAVGVANVVLLLALIGDTTGWRGARDAVYVAVALGFAAAFGVVVFIRDRSPRVVLVITILVVCSSTSWVCPASASSCPCWRPWLP